MWHFEIEHNLGEVDRFLLETYTWFAGLYWPCPEKKEHFEFCCQQVWSCQKRSSMMLYYLRGHNRIHWHLLPTIYRHECNWCPGKLKWDCGRNGRSSAKRWWLWERSGTWKLANFWSKQCRRRNLWKEWEVAPNLLQIWKHRQETAKTNEPHDSGIQKEMDKVHYKLAAEGWCGRTHTLNCS